MYQRRFSFTGTDLKFWQLKSILAVSGIFLLLSATPAMAHHAMGGRMPSNFFEGFMSGLAHPVIGPDHFAFIVAVGLLAAVKPRGVLITIAFILSAMLGTGLHLLGLTLPGAELLVSGSILLFGILLVMKDTPNTWVVAVLAAIAGVFHGYAYGESIFGAQATPLLAYLIGFTTIQSVILFGVFSITRFLLRPKAHQLPLNLQSSGLVLCGVGISFLASQVMSLISLNPRG